jgi:rod shape-determining protein MreC
MQNLFIFFRRNAFYFLFLLLMGISFVLIVRNNYYHRTVVINTTNDITGNLLAAVSSFTEYLALREANKQLAEQNARLLSSLPDAYFRTDTTTSDWHDSLYAQQFEYLTAKVISSSVNRRNNYLKLNKGANHGVGLNMAVIAPEGVVGQVVEVSGHFSSVMAVINTYSRISAKLKSSNQVGSLRWDGQDYRRVKLVDIPSHVQIIVGDSVVTSGYSHIYPEGRLIGFVEDFGIEPGENFYEVYVRLAVDFNQLSWVYIVNNLFMDELLQLEKTRISD